MIRSCAPAIPLPRPWRCSRSRRAPTAVSCPQLCRGHGWCSKTGDLDTVAAYQPAILSPEGKTTELLARTRYAAWSRPMPDLTLLITDDPGICEQRFAARIGRPVTDDERTLMRQAAALYELLAQAEPQRWHVISRQGRTSGEVLAAMAAACAEGESRA